MINFKLNPHENEIRKLLVDSYQPVQLDIINESGNHSMGGAETHFKIVIVADFFEGMKTVEKHREVNKTLMPAFEKVHAISFHIFSPKEWEAKHGPVRHSPACSSHQ